MSWDFSLKNTLKAVACRSPRRWQLLALALAAAAVVSSIVWWPGGKSRGPQPPELNLAGADPEVAAALEEAREAVIRQPQSAETWGLLARRLHAASLLDQAAVCYGEAERLDATNADWPYLHALILSAGPAPAEAVPLLQSAVERERASPLPRLRLGEVLLEQGRHEDAAGQFQAVLAIDPAEPRAHLRLAQLAAARQQWRECLHHLEPAAASPAARKQACALRLRAALALGDTAAAQDEQRLLAKLPDDAPWPDAIAASSLAFPFGLKSRLGLARELLSQRRAQQALALLEETVRKYPDSAAAWDNYGRVLGVVRQFAQAERALQRSLELTPHRGEVWFFLGVMRLEQGQFEEALVALREAARLKPTDPQARCKIGACLAGKGDLPGAAEAYQEALRLQPDLAEARDELAKLHRRPSP